MNGNRCVRCGAVDDVVRVDFWRNPDPANGNPLCRDATACLDRRNAAHAGAYLIRHHLAVPSHRGWHPPITLADLPAAPAPEER